MNKKNFFKKSISIFMCICLIFVSLFLIAYIVKDSNHVCSKDRCPVCAHILKAEKILKCLSNNVSNRYIIIFVALSYLSYIIVASLNIQVSTPITLKVKMIN